MTGNKINAPSAWNGSILLKNLYAKFFQKVLRGKLMAKAGGKTIWFRGKRIEITPRLWLECQKSDRLAGIAF
jgi:hypothetical protein